jgi:hypothetical protein
VWGGGVLGLAEQVAEVEEKLLGGQAFGEVGPLPCGDELLRQNEGRANVTEPHRQLCVPSTNGGLLHYSLT